MREIVLDIETTGLQYKDGDRIIDIACLELSNLIPNPQEELFLLIKQVCGKVNHLNPL